MEKVEYDLDTSGGLMEEIQALVAPPQTEETKKRPLSNKEAPLPKRPIRAVNRDSCDACNEGGDLLCCDQCPSSFHLQCCDPPLEDEDVPTGEWICNECKYGVKKKTDMKLFRLNSRSEQANAPSSPVDSNLGIHAFKKLVEMFRHKNPKEFQLPADIQDFTIMPGDRKRHVMKEQPKKKDDDGQRLCFVCTRSQRVGELVNCDFCPLVYHRDCLMPPLGQDPLGLWMCPNHPENFEPRLRHPKYSQRSQIIEELRSNINHNAVKLEFFRRAKKERILMNRRFHQPNKRRTCVVPDIVKSQYVNPPAVIIPDYIDNVNKTLQPHMKPVALPTSQEKEQWLRAVIDLQCSIAGSLEKDAGSLEKDAGSLEKDKSPTVAKEKDISFNTNATSNDTNHVVPSNVEGEKPMETDSSPVTLSSPIEKQMSLQQSVKEENVAADVQKTDVSHEDEPSLVCHENGGDIISTGFQMDHDGLCMKPPPDAFPPNSTQQEKGKVITQEDKPKSVEDQQRPHQEQQKSHEQQKQQQKQQQQQQQQDLEQECEQREQQKQEQDRQEQKEQPQQPQPQQREQSQCREKEVEEDPQKQSVHVSGNTSSTSASPLLSPAENTTTSSKASVSTQGNHMVSSISTEILKDPTLCQLDERLVRILAFQRLQQLIEKKSHQIPKISKPGITEKKVIVQVSENRPGIAVLSPLNGVGAGSYMRNKSFNAGQGADMDLCISTYGFCNYVSGKHATIFYDKETHQFELLNYSEHGTIVDNVLYSCDFSEKTKSNITSTNAKFDTNSKFQDTQQRLKKPPIGRTTRGLGTEFITQACNCRASASSLIGGSGAGWEGTAVLHHGSYIKFGCLHFIFSIVDCATNIPATTPRTNMDVIKLLPNTPRIVPLPVNGEPAASVT